MSWTAHSLARLIDRNQNVLKELAVRDLARELKESNGDVNGVIFDGVVTQRILDIAAEKGSGIPHRSKDGQYR